MEGKVVGKTLEVEFTLALGTLLSQTYYNVVLAFSFVLVLAFRLNFSFVLFSIYSLYHFVTFFFTLGVYPSHISSVYLSSRFSST